MKKKKEASYNYEKHTNPGVAMESIIQAKQQQELNITRTQ